MNIKKSVLDEVKIERNDLVSRDQADAYLEVSFRGVAFYLSCNEFGDTPNMYRSLWDDLFTELGSKNISLFDLADNLSADDDEDSIREIFSNSILNLDIIENAYDEAENEMVLILEKEGYQISPEYSNEVVISYEEHRFKKQFTNIYLAFWTIGYEIELNLAQNMQINAEAFY